jgi:hypothetical protein
LRLGTVELAAKARHRAFDLLAQHGAVGRQRGHARAEAFGERDDAVQVAGLGGADEAHHAASALLSGAGARLRLRDVTRIPEPQSRARQAGERQTGEQKQEPRRDPAEQAGMDGVEPVDDLAARGQRTGDIMTEIGAGIGVVIDLFRAVGAAPSGRCRDRWRRHAPARKADLA